MNELKVWWQIFDVSDCTVSVRLKIIDECRRLIGWQRRAWESIS